jgi:hypothetical protein
MSAAAVLGGFAASGEARAQAAGEDATTTCIHAYESAQEHRKAEQLLQARQELQVCAQPSCPAITQTDCTSWLGQVVDSIPTIVFSAKYDDENVFDVAVSMDGKPVAAQLDGRPIEVDPGLHTFVFTRSGNTAIEKKTIVSAREKAQVISVSWRSPVPSVASPTDKAEPVEKVRPIPPLFYVLTGTTVVGFGGFAVAALMGESAKSDLQNGCAPPHGTGCSQSEINKLQTRFLVADVAVGIGAASAAGALIVFLTRPEHEKPKQAGITSFGVAPTPQGAAFQLKGVF